MVSKKKDSEEEEDSIKTCEECGAVYNTDIAGKCPVCTLESRLIEKIKGRR